MIEPHRCSFLLVNCLLTIGLVAAEPPAERPVGPAREANNFLLPSDDEPKLEMFSLTKAAQSLDSVSLAWVQKHKCGSCHTGWPYLIARGALPDEPADALVEIR
jgi:hypothetical protein